jgi:hypothetical protein
VSKYKNRTKVNTFLCKILVSVQLFIEVTVYWSSDGTKATAKQMELFFNGHCQRIFLKTPIFIVSKQLELNWMVKTCVGGDRAPAIIIHTFDISRQTSHRIYMFARNTIENWKRRWKKKGGGGSKSG